MGRVNVGDRGKLYNTRLPTSFSLRLKLMITEAAGRTETLLPHIFEMLSDLGHDLKVFHIYESTLAANEEMGNDLMDIFVEMIHFWVQVIPFLRRNKHGKSSILPPAPKLD